MGKFFECSWLKTSYILFEDTGEIRKFLPTSKAKITEDNLELVFIPENPSKDVFTLKQEDLKWSNPLDDDFNFILAESVGFESCSYFYRENMDEELLTILDRRIGQNIISKRIGIEKLKTSYFMVQGAVYPATENNDSPTVKNISIYNMSTEKEVKSIEVLENTIYMDNYKITSLPTELRQIINSLNI